MATENLSFLQNFLNFIIKKYLKLEANNDLSMDECILCGLSVTGDITMP